MIAEIIKNVEQYIIARNRYETITGPEKEFNKPAVDRTLKILEDSLDEYLKDRIEILIPLEESEEPVYPDPERNDTLTPEEPPKRRPGRPKKNEGII